MKHFVKALGVLALVAGLLGTGVIGQKSLFRAYSNSVSDPSSSAGNANEKTANPPAKSNETHANQQTEASVRKGLDWLLLRQQKDGGWGPGHTTEGEVADVGNTCIAIQAMWRAGHRPGGTHYGLAMNRALNFVMQEIEASDDTSLFVTRTKGTQLQRKLGTYVDTFLAAATLAELKGELVESTENQRLERALKKVTSKIEAHQKADGSWQNEGWAPALAEGLAAKGLNKAAQNGVAVDKESLRRAERYGQSKYNQDSKSFEVAGAAGIELYGAASSITSLEESSRTNQEEKKRLEEQLALAPTEAKEKIRKDLDAIASNEKALADAQASLLNRLEDAQFMAGFGSNGGEEFLSYLQISESLHRKGGPDWQTWNRKIQANLMRVQDPDGCWRGQHCITGGTFCTATALLVLTEEQAKIPVSSALNVKR